MVRIRLSSAIAVDVDDLTLEGRDLGSRKARTLLALLASERGHLVPVDRIVDVLWGDDPPADPGANVSTLVSRTRTLLGDQVLTTSRRAYGLLGQGAWSVDLDEAAELVDEAEARLAAGEPALAGAASRRALELLGTQPALVDEPDTEWVLAVRAEADALRRRGRHLLASALADTSPAEAAGVAREAVAADPFDERAVRDLMRALVSGDQAAAALAAYDDLARRLRRELGTDPAAATAELHLAVLRASSGPAEDVEPRRSPARASLLGRDEELGLVERAWAAAGEGTGSFVLVEGEGGIGKTRLLEAAEATAEATGGLVLRCRCHPTERSLFLEPYVEAVRPVLLAQRESVLTGLLQDHEAAWVALMPELATLLPVVAPEHGPAELQRRRAYEAVAALLRRLARVRPVLLAVDDLQDGGAATVDLVSYLAARLQHSRLLLLAAVRSEDVESITRLSDRGAVLHLGALPRQAVDALARAAGVAQHSATVMERTAGHALSVVESLRALAAGERGVPVTLAEAVLARVDALPAAARDVIRAASVLRRRLDPQLLAELTESTELSAVRSCEQLASARLLVRSERHYEFANDLLQECVYASLPPALATAYHRRAADLTTSRPESMAEHAFAAGDLDRAAQGWLLAGENAMRRSAVDDAAALYGRALDVVTEPPLRARLLLARSRASEAQTSYAEGLRDIDEALALARAVGDRRLEMAALRSRGGDVPIGLHLPTAEVAAPLEAALAIASDLGDRPAEADVSARLSVLDVHRLRFTSAIERAERTLRRVGDRQDMRVLALDGLKTAFAYLGAADRLQAVVDELEPVLRRRESSWLLQWVVFESAFVPAARGLWEETRERVREALELNRRTGYTAYSAFFELYLGWFERLAGDLDQAVRLGRRAVELASPSDHPWWYAAACGQLAATLIDAGDPVEAERVARRGLTAAVPGTAEAVRLRCLAPLAVLSGDEADWSLAADLLRGIDAPAGDAWVAGADCYLLLGRAALRRGSLSEIAAPLQALRAATMVQWAPVRQHLDGLLAQMSPATS